MQEFERGFVAVAEGCTEIHRTTDLSHTVIGVFYTAKEARVACEMRATQMGNPVIVPWQQYERQGVWMTCTKSGETIYGITEIGHYWEDESC